MIPRRDVFAYTLQHVANRGVPPDSFLRELIAWAPGAPAEIFAPNLNPADIYAAVRLELGPWHGAQHRKAVMCEVLRVLAGFESSWRWNCGRDLNNPSEDSVVASFEIFSFPAFFFLASSQQFANLPT